MPSSCLRSYRQVLDEARKWGVRVQVSKTLPIEARVGPNLGAVDHDGATIYLLEYELEKIGTQEGPLWLLHELVHCLVQTPPQDVDEFFSGMFAVEGAIAKACRLPGYQAWVRRYYRYTSLPLEAVPACTLRSLHWISRQTAMREGLLNEEGALTYKSKHIKAVEKRRVGVYTSRDSAH